MDWLALVGLIERSGWVVLAIVGVWLWMNGVLARQLYDRLREREREARSIDERPLYAGGRFPATDAFLAGRSTSLLMADLYGAAPKVKARHYADRAEIAKWIAPPVVADAPERSYAMGLVSANDVRASTLLTPAFRGSGQSGGTGDGSAVSTKAVAGPKR